MMNGRDAQLFLSDLIFSIKFLGSPIEVVTSKRMLYLDGIVSVKSLHVLDYQFLLDTRSDIHPAIKINEL